MNQIDCHLERGSYPVLIKPGLLGEIGDIVAGVAPSHQCTLALDSAVVRSHGQTAARSLAEAGFTVKAFEIEALESSKTPATVTRIHRSMALAKHERRSPLITVGGGIVGDTAGFAAATFHRGVPLVHGPTTLLAMVDAAIGGKTAVNLRLPDDRDDACDEPVSVERSSSERFVKNVVGAFHQPRAVVIDPMTLRTLDLRELRCGIAECIKHALLTADDFLEFIEDHIRAALKGDVEVLTDLIARSVAVKVAFVEDDPLEMTGRRALLNLGHTFAHAIELIDELSLKHGEAVAIGLCAASDLSVRMGLLTAGRAERIRRLVATCGLPVLLTEPLLAGPLIDAMSSDKKVEGGRVRLVLPLERGGAELRDDVPRSAVEAAWVSVGAE